MKGYDHDDSGFADELIIPGPVQAHARQASHAHSISLPSAGMPSSAGSEIMVVHGLQQPLHGHRRHVSQVYGRQ